MRRYRQGRGITQHPMTLWMNSARGQGTAAKPIPILSTRVPRASYTKPPNERHSMSDIPTLGIYIGGGVSLLLVLAKYLRRQKEVRISIRNEKRTISFNMSSHDEDDNDNDSTDPQATPILRPKTPSTKVKAATQDSKKILQRHSIGKSKA
jgi:hypothetical protein